MGRYGDFNMGYGLFTTINLFIQAVLFWQLGTLAKSNAAGIKPILVLFSLGYIAMTVVAWRYFFIGPAITELIIAGCLAAAFFTAGSASA